MATATPSATPRPSPLACDACRRKHLKCDGTSPVCRRCVVEAIACTYTASRRGLGRRSKRNDRSVRSVSTDPRPPPTARSTPAMELDDSSSLMAANSTMDTTPQATDIRVNAPGVGIATTPWSLDPVDRERLLSLFYVHFFGAHPFIVPKAFYNAQQYPRYLHLVVCLVGHHYTSPISDAIALRNAVALAMSEPDDYSVHRVQALLLYSIMLHSCHQPKAAGSYLSRAAAIALHLGMNEPSFARSRASGYSVMEESFRRTWWELYTVDLYLATIHRRPTFDTKPAKCLPLLPCTQAMFEAGQCEENPPTLRIYENRVFMSSSQMSFSPYSYRIDAIRLVGRVLTLSTTDGTQSDDVQALDSALTSWEYNLPAVHAETLGPSGEVDLLMFQARCFVACAKLLLHFPRSELPPTVPSARDIACARNHTQLASTSRQHTVKAVAASKELSSLATVPWPLDRHSPFLVCGLVLACIVQLAAASIHFHECAQDCLSQHRDRVVLMLGALGRLGERWDLAQNAVRKLRIVAETIFVVGEYNTALSVNNSLHDSAIDGCADLSETFWFDLFSPENMDSDLFSV